MTKSNTDSTETEERPDIYIYWLTLYEMLLSNIAEYVIFHCAALIPAYYTQTTTVVPGNILYY